MSADVELATARELGQRSRRIRIQGVEVALTKTVEGRVLKGAKKFMQAQLPALITETSEEVAKRVMDAFQQKRDRALQELLSMYSQNRISPVKLLKKNLVTLATEVVQLRLAADALLKRTPTNIKAFNLYRAFLTEHRKLLREMREVMMQLHKLQKEKRGAKTDAAGTIEDLLGGGDAP